MNTINMFSQGSEEPGETTKRLLGPLPGSERQTQCSVTKELIDRYEMFDSQM